MSGSGSASFNADSGLGAPKPRSGTLSLPIAIRDNIGQEEVCLFLRHLLRHLYGPVIVLLDNSSTQQIHIGTVVLACRGKWSDRERRHIAQRIRNFIWQGKAKKISVLVGACILERQHGDYPRACRINGKNGRMPRLPEVEGYHGCGNNANSSHNYPTS
jgi:hypothetical protein